MRVAFVGCGRHARAALYPALEPAGLELVAVCAGHLDRASAVADRYGVAAFDDVTTMLDTAAPDGLIAAVPVDAYGEVVSASLAREVPVFCEKPGAADARTLAALIEQAATTPLVVGYMKRFAPAYAQALAAVQSAEFGALSSAHARFVVGPGFGTARHYVIDNVVHALDLLRLFGGEVTELWATCVGEGSTGWAIAASMAFARSGVATLQASCTGSFHQENELLDIVGAGWSASVRNVDTVDIRPPYGPVQRHRPTYTVPLPANFTGTTMGFVPELVHFREVVTQGATNRSDGPSALATLRLAERLCETLGI